MKFLKPSKVDALPGSGKLSVLVVEDEKDTREFIQNLLVSAGHAVTAASSAVEAMVHVHMKPFDLVLLDIMMPGIDGHQFAHHLSTQWNTFEIPIVVISCRTDRESKSLAKLSGCVKYIEKPFSPAELLDTVRQVARSRVT